MIRGTLVARLLNVAQQPTPASAALCREAGERIQELEERLRHRNDPADSSTHRGRNYNLCRALDMTRLSMSEDDLVAAGADGVDVSLIADIVRRCLDALRRQNPEDETTMRHPRWPTSGVIT